MLLLPLVQLTVWSAAAGATVAESCVVAPIIMVTLLGATVTPVGAGRTTVTAAESLWPPVLVAVMVALPVATPCTTPLALTVAMPVLLLTQVTRWFALAGATLAESCVVAPMATFTFLGETVTPVLGAALTVMTALSVCPLELLAVMVTLPCATPVTRPF